MSRRECPNCGNPDAVKVLWKVKCPNPACPYFDASLRERGAMAADTVTVHPPVGEPRRGGAPAPGEAPGWTNTRGGGQTPPLARLCTYGGIALIVTSFLGFGLRHGAGLGVLLVFAGSVIHSRNAARLIREDARARAARRATTGPRPARPAPPPLPPPPPPFDPTGSRRIEIRFRNFRREEKTFTADLAGARWKRNHLLIRVGPKGRQIALDRDRILNLSEVQPLLK